MSDGIAEITVTALDTAAGMAATVMFLATAWRSTRRTSRTRRFVSLPTPSSPTPPGLFFSTGRIVRGLAGVRPCPQFPTTRPAAGIASAEGKREAQGCWPI